MRVFDWQANLKHLLDCVSKNDVEGITKWTDKGLDPNFNTCGDGGNTCWFWPMIVKCYKKHQRPGKTAKTENQFGFGFYRTLVHDIDIAVLSVCPSVTFRYSMEMA